jgi:hypothetical protein
MPPLSTGSPDPRPWCLPVNTWGPRPHSRPVGLETVSMRHDTVANGRFRQASVMLGPSVLTATHVTGLRT